MATFDSAVRSQALSRPIILYTITTANEVFRHTLNGTDVTFGGNLFTALTIAHDDEQVSQDTSGDALTIHLPVTHPLVRRYVSTGIPAQTVQVTVQELQSAAGSAMLSWSGPAQSMTLDAHLAHIRIPTTTSDAIKIQLPVIAAQRTCNHVLFDRGCAPLPGGDWPLGSGNGHGGPVRIAFQFDTNPIGISADRTIITVSSVGGFPSDYFLFGKIIATHAGAPSLVADDQVRTIVAQASTSLTLNLPFIGGIAVPNRSDRITLEAGCSHAMTGAQGCVAKFANRANFGGAPQMNPTINPWVPNGLGVIQQV